jgi:RNase H-fold protein (predicted Holliday junction resolvase)
VGPSQRTDRELLDDEFKSLRAARGVVTALGVDYGTRRAGIAVSVGGNSTRPVAVVPSVPPSALIDVVLETAMRERADVIVVGLPKPPRDFHAERAERRRRELYGAVVDVSDLSELYFDAEDVADDIGADALKARLGMYSMKQGGTLEERARRLWRLVEAGGDLDLVPSGAFVGGEAGKRTTCAAVRNARETDGGTVGDGLLGGDRALTLNPKPRGRAPVKMHVLARRFAENLADAARSRGLSSTMKVVMVDESATSAEADLIAATARKGRGLKDRAKGAHLDDIAAGVLLDRYFAGTHGAAEEIPPMGGDDVSR